MYSLNVNECVNIKRVQWNIFINNMPKPQIFNNKAKFTLKLKKYDKNHNIFDFNSSDFYPTTFVINYAFISDKSFIDNNL